MPYIVYIERKTKREKNMFLKEKRCARTLALTIGELSVSDLLRSTLLPPLAPTAAPSALTSSERSGRCCPVNPPCVIYCCEDMMKVCRAAVLSASVIAVVSEL